MPGCGGVLCFVSKNLNFKTALGDFDYPRRVVIYYDFHPAGMVLACWPCSLSS
jgi:hypothetical protein